MKAKFLLGMMLLCVAATMLAIAMVIPRYYPQLKKKVVHVENISEIANESYARDVVPILLLNKSNKIGYDISDDAIRSATLLGPFPMFFAKETPKDMKSMDSILKVFKHNGYDFAFLALDQGNPIAYIEMSNGRGSLSMTGTYNASYAKRVYQAYSKLRNVSKSDKMILRIGMEICFADDTDRLAFIGGFIGGWDFNKTPKEGYPTVSYGDLLRALEETQTHTSHPKEGSPALTHYLFHAELSSSSSHRPAPYILGGAGVILIGEVLWILLKRKGFLRGNTEIVR